MSDLVSEAPDLILGAGMTGLIAAHYLTKHIVVSNPPTVTEASTGPFYLHETPLTRKLLRELQLDESTHPIRWDYCKEQHFMTDTAEAVREYHQCLWEKDPSEAYIINRVKRKTNVHYTTIDQVHEKLQAECADRIIPENVIGILPDKKVLFTPWHVIRYNSLISTLPAPVYTKLCNREAEYTFRPIYSALVPTARTPIDIYSSGLDYYYNIGSPIYRITRWRKPWVVAESFQQIMEYPNTKFPYGKIFSQEPVQDGTKFLGRWAQWDANVKINDTLRMVKEWSQDNEHI